MTQESEHVHEPTSRQPIILRRFRIPRIDAATFLIVYCGFLLLIPSRLVVGPIGSAGAPASLWGMLGLLWWVCACIAGHIRGAKSPIRWAISILICAVLASYASAMAHGWYAPPDIRQVTDFEYDVVPPTPGEITEKMISAADRGLLALAGWIGVALVAADGLRSWAQIDRLVKWLVRLGVLVALLGIFQFFTGTNISGLFSIPGLQARADFGAVDARSILNRVSATAIHPIEFGVVIAAILPLSLHRSIYARRSVIGWIPTIILGVAIPMAVSRSAIVVMAVASLVVFIGWPWRWRTRALLILPLAAVALRGLIPGLLGTILALFTNLSTDPSTTGRTDDYLVVLPIFADNPWLGRGMFTFVPQYYRTLDNQLLISLLELGAIGLTVMLGVFATGYFCARGAILRTDHAEHRHFALVISASIAGVVLSYVTFDVLTFPMAAGLTFILLGLAGAAWQVAYRGQSGRELTASRNPSDVYDQQSLDSRDVAHI